MPILSTITRAEGLRNTIIALVIIAVPLLWQYLHGEKLTQRYIYRQARQTFFCGYSMELIAQQHLLNNLERFLDLDLSSVIATLMMILLHDNDTARLVRCRFNDGAGEYWHSWVEFRHLGSWYVLDPSWYECLEVKKQEFDRKGIVGEPQIYSHHQFWSFPISKQIYRKLHHPNTSYLFFELYGISSNGYYKDAPDFDENRGREFKPLWFNGSQVVSREIVDFLMQSADYREPPREAILAGIHDETHDYFRNHSEEDTYEPD